MRDFGGAQGGDLGWGGHKEGFLGSERGGNGWGGQKGGCKGGIFGWGGHKGRLWGWGVIRGEFGYGGLKEFWGGTKGELGWGVTKRVTRRDYGVGVGGFKRGGHKKKFWGGGVTRRGFWGVTRRGYWVEVGGGSEKGGDLGVREALKEDFLGWGPQGGRGAHSDGVLPLITPIIN